MRPPIGNDPPVAHLPPRLARRRRARAGVGRDRLDEHAGLAELPVVDRARHLARVVHAAPERRVVERLAARALRVGVGRLRLGHHRRRDRRLRSGRQHDRRPQPSLGTTWTCAGAAGAACGDDSRAAPAPGVPPAPAARRPGRRQRRAEVNAAFARLGRMRAHQLTCAGHSRSDPARDRRAGRSSCSGSPGVHPGARNRLSLFSQTAVSDLRSPPGGIVCTLSPQPTRTIATIASSPSRSALMTSSPVRGRRRACPAMAFRTRCPSPRPRCPCRG